jgi:hypothetical protein
MFRFKKLWENATVCGLVLRIMFCFAASMSLCQSSSEVFHPDPSRTSATGTNRERLKEIVSPHQQRAWERGMEFWSALVYGFKLLILILRPASASHNS